MGIFYTVFLYIISQGECQCVVINSVILYSESIFLVQVGLQGIKTCEIFDDISIHIYLTSYLVCLIKVSLLQISSHGRSYFAIHTDPLYISCSYNLLSWLTGDDPPPSHPQTE